MIKHEGMKEQMGKLEHLWERREDLQQSLKRSLMIQELWLDAFKNGGCKSIFVGNFQHPDKMKFVIRNGDGETAEFGLREVPRTLLLHSVERIKPGLSERDRRRLEEYLGNKKIVSTGGPRYMLETTRYGLEMK